jgi:hypothetical protein
LTHPILIAFLVLIAVFGAGLVLRNWLNTCGMQLQSAVRADDRKVIACARAVYRLRGSEPT